MRRREFVLLAIGTGLASATSLPGFAQEPATRRPLIVWFGSGNRSAADRYIDFLRKGLEEFGYGVTRPIDFTSRFADFQVERLPVIAREVTDLKPTVIVASAVDTALMARKATSTIPIVSGALADADHLGLIASFSRPGGNVTGIAPYVPGLPAKQIELAREVVPHAKRIGLLGNMNDPKAPPQRDELVGIAQKLQLDVVVPDIAGPGDIAGAIQTLSDGRVDVVIVLQTTLLLVMRKQIAPGMAASRLPAVYGYREHIDQGGLISYGVDLAWCWRRLATYVHKIIEGAAPADLPVEFPSRMQMVVNMNAAKALDLELPATLLARADEVVE